MNEKEPKRLPIDIQECFTSTARSEIYAGDTVNIVDAALEIASALHRIATALSDLRAGELGDIRTQRKARE